MTQNGNEYMSGDHRNPFVPVPPPARRSSRHDFEDTEYSAHPFSPEQVNGHHGYNQHEEQHDHGTQNALAAAAGGAALGGLAAHARARHERTRSGSRGRHVSERAYSEDEHNALPQATHHRRSGSVNRANAKEPWPYGDEHKTSRDMASTGRRSMSRSQENFTTPMQHPHEHNSMPIAGAALAGVGAGALAAHHHHHKNEPRKGILKQTYSDSTNPTSTTDDSQSSTPFVDAPLAHNSGPHELASTNLPDAPTRRSRPTSALGTAAPLAAVGAVGARATARARSSSTTISKSR